MTNAMEVAEELGTTADALIGHFVDQARRTGASWSDIGRSMGTSKQAAQKRFVSRGQAAAASLDSSQGFSRFRDDARSVVITAQEQARKAGNNTISVGHLVLGLVASADTMAARAIVAQTGSVQEIERTALVSLPPATTPVPALIPFDEHSRTVLEGAFAQAQRRSEDSIGSEHLLLSLLAAEEGTGVLAGLGVTGEAVEAFLMSEAN